MMKQMAPLTTLVMALAAILLVVQLLDAGPPKTRQGLREPVFRSRHQSSQRQAAQVAQAPARLAASRQEEGGEKQAHPLQSVVDRAEKMLAYLRSEVKDYSATLVKHERIDGVLNNPQYISLKIRHEQQDRAKVAVPFSVYMHFEAPDDLKGREVLWVKGHNGGKMIAHDGGTGLIAAIKSAVTVTIEPDAPIAMNGNKYPITDVGLENLLSKLSKFAREDMKHDEVDVKYFKGTKINGRVCTCLQSVHPIEREHFRYHIVRIYIDDEMQLPIRYESYGWPKRGEKPPLLEAYTYLNLKLNNGFTDTEFSRDNPRYNFN